MSYRLIDTAISGFDNRKAVCLTGPNTSLNYSISSDNLLTPTGSLNKYVNFDVGHFSMGTGILVDTNGVMLYDEITSGSGVLNNVLLINVSANKLYFGFNSSTPSISNGIPLGSGESYQVETPDVRKVWAITDSGSSYIAGGGIYKWLGRVL